MAGGGEAAWGGDRVRRRFIEFFQERAHDFVPSSPVVPHDDPTLLFANAGMNQYKPIFLGRADPNGPLAKLKRAVNSQKCIRAGGKHNDLDDVGKDTYHHTFFEMLGNWSFGDFFKREAVNWAMELLVDVYGLEKERLYATYFGGDEAQGLPPDLECRDIWLEILPPERVLPFGCADNFWEMGDVGPCGPCTEIHYDRIGGRDAAHLVNMDDPNCIEVWNLVFIQFNREVGGALKPLPQKHVDTGMGLERIASILQGKMSNYDTDLFIPIFEEIQRVTGAAPYTGKLGEEDAGEKDMAYRVVADHIRTLCFALADGARPGNEGREYVLRRVLRRGVRYGREKLGGKEGFFSGLTGVVVKVMGGMFPELVKAEATIREVLADEEKSFGRTLNKGIERFQRMSAALPAGGQLSGQDAFLLWDTFGFPVDLTELMAEERGLGVDKAGFEAAMKEAKDLSKAAGKKTAGATMKLEAQETASLAAAGVQPTDDGPKYLEREIECCVKAILVPGEGLVQTRGAGEGACGVVLEATNFYAEAGGQVSDHGALDGASGALAVVNVQSAAGYVVHIGSVERGTVSVGDRLSCKVDWVRRRKVVPNHTATHMLNFALREVVGDNVDQKGSLVDDEKLRFDFSNSKPVSAKALTEAEAIVRRDIEKDMEVFAEVVPLKDAEKIHGLRAVFGEKYPDPVRVVSVGRPVDVLIASPDAKDNREYSVEFCGGTHLKTTGQTGPFAILSEEGISKGVRRVVAVTGDVAASAIASGQNLLERVKQVGSLADAELQAECAKLKREAAEASIPVSLKSEVNDTLAAYTKKLLEAGKKMAAENKKKAVEEAVAAVNLAAENGGKFCVLRVNVGLDAKALGEAVTQAQKAHADVPLMLLSTDEAKDKLMVYAGCDKGSVKDGFDAGKWAKDTLAACGGKGGGKPTSATGQAPGAGNLNAAIEAANAFAKLNLC